jgi:hypothetical protein
MPRSVRNFWATVNVDGRKSQFASGPRARDGGLQINIKVRDKGTVQNAIVIMCRHIDGENRILVTDPNGVPLAGPFACPR